MSANRTDPTTVVPVTGTEHDTYGGNGEVAAARPRLLRPGSPLPTYAGLALCVLGFVLLAYSWGKVAGEVEVWRQMPYLVSGGFTGLGLVLVGVTLVNIAAKRADAAARERQDDQLAEALRELRQALEDVR